eukprot:CAMPEP_0197495208 /NCGR_PEP_ID=MMETSP1311-20131121/34952_1 /TAXON_ID=464262 /ORGANISM="Genus nov. species nov., Strain RCC856" /LENGTH=233 /DNA_ID=CAMNT_0043040683 /DNA_START=86 /DNA_END=787 /DNA_ORIENTATION=-
MQALRRLTQLQLAAGARLCLGDAVKPLAASSSARLFQTGSAPRFEEETKANPSLASQEAFLKKWNEVAPSTMDPPSFASEFAAKSKEPAADGAVPEKVTFNFFLPHEKPYSGAEVDMVLVPAVSGDFGVMPGHVPTAAQLRPGVLTVQEDEGTTKKFFVSSGFAFVHADSTTDVCAVEAFPVEDLDPATVEAGLADYTAKLATATSGGDDYEAAAAQIGVEVYSAMNAALAEK